VTTENTGRTSSDRHSAPYVGDGSRRLLKTIALLLLVLASVINVDIVEPTVNVRWVGAVDDGARQSLERLFGLDAAQWLEGTTWRYVLRNRSRENIAALVAHPDVEDTHDLDRSELTAPGPQVQVSLRGWSMLLRAAQDGLFQVQSFILVACGSLLLWFARLRDSGKRRRAAAAVLIAAGVLAFVFPLGQPIKMGDSDTYTDTRRLFDQYAAVRQIRSEAHLSWVILARLDSWYGRRGPASLA
jgi:hypothetical protein